MRVTVTTNARAFPNNNGTPVPQSAESGDRSGFGTLPARGPGRLVRPNNDDGMAT